MDSIFHQARTTPMVRPRGLDRPVSLSEVLDRVLNKGAVVTGEIVISVAGVDLVYLGVNLVLTSIQTARDCQRQMHGGDRRDAH
jgi:hypothetical protein